MFGVLRDASPDSWGRRVIEKRAGKARLDEMDYLLHSPDDRAGALGFGLNVEPPAPLRNFNRTMDLSRLQELADLIVADEEPAESTPAARADLAQVQDLLLIGTAIGGARPKALVQDADALWIVKFNRKDDTWNQARVEHSMLELARECGLVVSQSRLSAIADRDALLVRRFDREHTAQGYRRARMLSALTLLRAEDAYQDRERWSYMTLAEELRRISAQPTVDAPELFRRMAFNALISNLDDHPRNHAVIVLNQDWNSPAGDLTPSCSEPRAARHSHDLRDRTLRERREPVIGASVSPRAAMLRGYWATEAAVRAHWYEVARREGGARLTANGLRALLRIRAFG
jgi:serine/threonine-protein kinase HipA